MMSVLLSEEVRKKSSRSTETPGSDLSVDRRGRSENRDKKKNERLKSKLRKGTSKSRGVGRLTVW